MRPYRVMLRFGGRLRGDGGQTASEYLGIVAVIAVVIAVLANTLPGPVADAFSTAICRVSGGEGCGGAGPAVDRAADDPAVGRAAPAPDVRTAVPADRGAALPRSPEVPTGPGAELAALPPPGQDAAAAESGAPADGGGGALGWLGDTASALASGFVEGDFAREPPDNGWLEGARSAGQILSGVLVFGDVRDAAAAAQRLWSSGFREGWADLGLSVAGIVPIAGDIAKSAKGVARVDEAIDVARAAEAARITQRATHTANELQTALDFTKKHLNYHDLDAARRELRGEVVATRSDGIPYDHVTEVRQTQKRLLSIIERAKGTLGDPRLSPEDRKPVEQILGEASRMLDHSKGFVPPNG